MRDSPSRSSHTAGSRLLGVVWEMSACYVNIKFCDFILLIFTYHWVLDVLVSTCTPITFLLMVM